MKDEERRLKVGRNTKHFKFLACCLANKDIHCISFKSTTETSTKYLYSAVIIL